MKLTKVRSIRYSKYFSIVGWFDLTFFLIAGCWALIDAGWRAAIFSFPFMLLGFYLILYGQTRIEMGPDSITRHSALGKHRIAWNEIKWIEHDPAFNVLVFQGENKRLVVVGPGYWVGREKYKLRTLMGYKIGQMELHYRESFWSQFKLSRNVRATDDVSNGG